MHFDKYQEKAKKTAVYPETLRILYPTLGLAGEAGEVANKIKKIYRDHKGILTPEQKQEIASELGDVLWYVAAIATDLDLDLSKIAFENIEKLVQRFLRNMIQGTGDKR